LNAFARLEKDQKEKRKDDDGEEEEKPSEKKKSKICFSGEFGKWVAT